MSFDKKRQTEEDKEKRKSNVVGLEIVIPAILEEHEDDEMDINFERDFLKHKFTLFMEENSTEAGKLLQFNNEKFIEKFKTI